MDINAIIQLILNLSAAILMVIGGASLIFKYISPWTKNKIDDKIYKVLDEIFKFLSQAREEAVKVKIENDK